MSSQLAKMAIRIVRLVFVNGLLLVAAGYLLLGPAPVHDTASRMLARAEHFIKVTAASSELRTLETQIADDRATVEAAIERRNELQSRIRELVNLRNDALAGQIELAERLAPMFVALHDAANGKLIQVGERLFDRSDVHGRMLELESRHTAFERQISESEKAIGQLMSGLNDLDRRIAAGQLQIDSRERELHMKRHKLEAERARNDVVHHLESLRHSESARNYRRAAQTPESEASNDIDLSELLKGLESCSSDDGGPHRSQVALPSVSPKKPAVPPFFIEGTFVPSGWMGDGENPSGPLKREVSKDAAYGSPTCDKWSYLPPAGAEQRWVAVAYQGPTANNWGAEKGVDLSGKGYTRLTFMARGEKGGERLLVKSGGCTTPGARHPASYEATIGRIVLDSSWKEFEIPLDGSDLSNICSVFSFAIKREMAPEGCAFYLDDIALRGPKDN